MFSLKQRNIAKRPSSSLTAGGMQAGSFTVRYVPSHGGRMLYVDCLTDRNALKEKTVTSYMCFATLAMNSGRPTGICASLPIVARGEVTETAGIQSGTESDPGGSVATAEVRREGQRGLAADERTKEGEAGAERGEPLTNKETTKGRPDLGTARAGQTGIEAEAETGREAKMESNTEREREEEIMTGSTNIAI